MCLAVPMRLVEIEGVRAVADLDGARHQVDVSLIDGVELEDYVIVHAGFAIEKLDRAEADERIALFDSLAAENARAVEESL